VTNAAIAAGARRAAMYGWRKEDPVFAGAWDDAIEAGTDKLEDEARRRALNGSDPLLMFMLKARRPAKYRERSVHEHTGPAGGPVQVEVARTAREELAARITEIAARAEVLGSLQAFLAPSCASPPRRSRPLSGDRHPSHSRDLAGFRLSARTRT